MTPDLLPNYRRLLEENSIDFLPSNIPWNNYTPMVYPSKNEFDVDITRSNNDTNIELAKIFERITIKNNRHQEILSRENTKVQQCHCGTQALIAGINSNPGKSDWSVDVLGEERGFFRRQPKIFGIRIKSY